MKLASILHPHDERSILPTPGLLVPHHRVGPAAEWKLYLRHRRQQGYAALVAFLAADAWLLFWILVLAELE